MDEHQRHSLSKTYQAGSSPEKPLKGKLKLKKM
jgi:hypothetical protein